MKHLIIAAAMIVISSGVEAHDAKSGWTYPSDCCGGGDCYEISEKDLVVTGQGWRVKATGEIFPYNQTRRPEDGQYHRCSVQGNPALRTYCLFTPEPGS